MEITTIFIVLIFLIGLFLAYWIGHKAGCFKRDRYWKSEIPAHRKEAIMKSRAVIGGHFTENLAPYLPSFPYKPTECRFIGNPTDFIVFRGMDEKNIKEIVFVEVKSGNSKLSSQEKNLKESIDKKKVRFEQYKIPKELTEKKDIEERIDGFVNDED